MGSPVILGPSPMTYNTNIQVGIDEQGKALAVWGADQDFIWAKNFDGSTWLSPSVISRPSMEISRISLGVTPEGKAAVVWTGAWRPSDREIRYFGGLPTVE